MYDDVSPGDLPPRPPGCTCSGTIVDDTSQCPVCGPQPYAKLIPIVEKRSFDFSNYLSGAGGPEVHVVLCPAVCVLGYTLARLLVRVHARTMSSGQLLRFQMWSTLPSDEDPGQDFVASAALATADISATTAVPSLVSAGAFNPDAFVKISVRIIQAGTPAPFLATLSVNLLLRMG